MTQDNTPPVNDVVDLDKAVNLKLPKGVLKITIEVMMPRPEHPELCDHVACQPQFLNIFPNRDFKHIPVEMMPKIRSIVAQMVELARRHVHKPLSPEQQKAIQQIEKPKGAPQIELYKQNMVTGEMVQVGEPLKLDANMNPIEPLVGSTRD